MFGSLKQYCCVCFNYHTSIFSVHHTQPGVLVFTIYIDIHDVACIVLSVNNKLVKWYKYIHIISTNGVATYMPCRPGPTTFLESQQNKIPKNAIKNEGQWG